MKNIKSWIKTRDNYIIQTSRPIIEFMYLFVKFKYESFKTNLYLRSKWRDICDSKVPLDFISELTMPDSDYYIFNPTLTFTKGEFKYFGRMSNISHKPKTNFWEKNTIKSSPENLINGICSFELDDLYNVANFSILIEPTITPNFEDPRSFEFNNELSPVVIKADDLPEFLGIIMPLKL